MWCEIEKKWPWLLSFHSRSSHTRDGEQSQERLRESGPEERWRDNGRRDIEKETSPSTPDMSRERERSVSLERDQRSSSEERESGEI